MEVAVVKLVEAARQKDVSPTKLARMAELTIEKVMSGNPAGEQALKIIQTNTLKNLLRTELKVAVRMAKGPRKPRTAKAKGKRGRAERKPLTPQEKADALLHKTLSDSGGNDVAKTSRARREAEPAE